MDIKKSFRPIVENITAQYLPVAVGGLVFILAWLSQQLLLWQMLLLALVLCVLVIWFINQIDIWRARHKRKITKLSEKELEDTIRNWLVDDPGYKFQRKDINDPLFHNDRLFHFEVEDEWGRTISVARPRAKPTRLDLSSAIFLALEHKKKYEALSSGEKKNLIHILRVEMARIGVMFKGIETSLERIDIGDSVSLDDNLTEFYLKQRILFMIRAVFLLNELIIQELD